MTAVGMHGCDQPTVHRVSKPAHDITIPTTRKSEKLLLILSLFAVIWLLCANNFYCFSFDSVSYETNLDEGNGTSWSNETNTTNTFDNISQSTELPSTTTSTTTVTTTTQFKVHLDDSLMDLIHVSEKAKTLPNKGSIFCWVLTSSNQHHNRAIAINQTWINKCDHGQLFTNAPMTDERIPYSTVFAGIPNKYENLFYKTRFAFHYIYANVSKDFDWYMKADDDTYVIVEHLRKYLSTLDPSQPHYLGYKLAPLLAHGYNGGGGGYVLSRAALRQFEESAYRNETACPHNIYEDVGMGRCLESLGIYPSDTRNEKGQNRFNGYNPATVYFNRLKDSGYPAFPEHGGFRAFAEDLITFHHLSPDDIRLFHALLYHVHKPNETSVFKR